MTDSSTNPFILPGMGQSSNLSGNPLLASMEMMKQAWAGLTGPGGLAQALPMTAPMNVEELERRIADLRAVEGWLRMNLSMLGSTIQGMEVQRATIATLRSFIDSAASLDTGSAPAPGQPTPLEIVLGIKPAPKDDKAASAASSADAPGADAASPGPEALDSAARSASRAWWDLMQQQFNNIAQATVASMSSMASAPEATAQQAPAERAPSAPAGGAPRAADATAAKTAKPAAKKTAARKTPARKAAARKTAAKPAADKT
ncbi:regulatory protein [Bordetella ansorpii]|uniref:Regulatory protein n=1 Tax=Bordetella ansorpii TaxID=288768 RepID=A0A157NCM9_9BORD|nr:PhaM family polyhydroxyalkanoate granule multifunctional regulatory protein [Bordetella ansorpii]SAI19107.1 regulatory protein [Bordetella ansorpii]